MTSTIVNKFCPSCRKKIQVDPTASEGICSSCGITYSISPAKTKWQTVQLSHGIVLKYSPKYKKCGKCLETKSIEMFHKNSYTSTGHAHWCKECTSTHNNTRSKSVYRAHTKYDPCRVPKVASHEPLSKVLPYLIKASKRGVNAESILKESIVSIQESLA